jgi:hypothetical protein
MRKLILFAVMLSLLAFAGSASAQQEKIDVYQQKKLVKSVVFQVGLNEYFVDNKVPGAKMDVAPFVENGRTFVPVRFLSNALGVQNQNIFWFNDTGQVKLQEPGFPVVELTVGKAEVLSNGSPVSGVDVAPLVKSDRTFLPARFVANALGYDVDWDPALNLVTCWPKGDPKPDVSAVKAELKKWTWTDTGYRVPSVNGGLFKEWHNKAEGIYWTKAGLEIDPCKDGLYNIELDLLIMPPDYKGSWEAYDQAEAILASKFGPEFAGKVMSYVRQKKSRRDMCDEPWRTYYAPNGQKVDVGMG